MPREVRTEVTEEFTSWADLKAYLDDVDAWCDPANDDCISQARIVCETTDSNGNKEYTVTVIIVRSGVSVSNLGTEIDNLATDASGWTNASTTKSEAESNTTTRETA